MLVNNHLDQSLNEPAKAWESKLVEFMRDYAKAHPNITIAFSSEVCSCAAATCHDILAGACQLSLMLVQICADNAPLISY